jgi:hypothetical protein
MVSVWRGGASDPPYCPSGVVFLEMLAMRVIDMREGRLRAIVAPGHGDAADGPGTVATSLAFRLFLAEVFHIRLRSTESDALRSFRCS